MFTNDEAITALKNIKAAYISNKKIDIKDIHKIENAIMRNNPLPPYVRPATETLPRQFYCPECRNIIDDNQKYCTECGQHIYRG